MEQHRAGLDTGREQLGQGEATQAKWKDLFVFASKSHAATLFEGITVSALAGLLAPAFAFLLGRVFEDFSTFGATASTAEKFSRDVAINTKYLVVLGLASCLINMTLLFVWVSFGELQARAGRDLLLKSILGRSIGWFDVQVAGVGAVLERLQSQMKELQIAISQPFGFIVQHLITCIAALGLAFWHSWDLTLVSLATIPVALILLAYISGRMQPAIDGQTDELTAATRQVKSVVETIEVVKSFNAQYEEALKYLETIERAAGHYLAQARWNGAQIGFVRLLTRALFVQGFWYGSHLVQTGSRTPGQILTAFWGCLMATQTFDLILPQMLVLEKGRSAGFDLKEFLCDDEPRLSRRDDYVASRPFYLKGNIKISHVRFSYPSVPDQVSLDNVNMLLLSQRTTFIVGRSGSGKSTVASLLLRFYDNWTGQITIDDTPIRSIDLHSLRQNITVVTQESVLFNDTMLRNITFGKSHGQKVTMTAVDESVKLASLSEVIDVLPNGIDTLIGTGGTSLSGGQTQRVAIARARLRDAPIVILDECTSALDRNTARAVMKSILEWRRGKTTIIITHDIGQVRRSDYLYVLEKGRVVQHGQRCSVELEKDGQFVNLLKAAGVTNLPQTPAQAEFKLEEAPRKGTDVDKKKTKALPDPFQTPSLKAPRSQGSVFESVSLPLSPLSPSFFGRAPIASAAPAISLASNHVLRTHTSTIQPFPVLGQSVSDSRPHCQSTMLSVARGIEQYKQARESWIQRKRKRSETELDLLRATGSPDLREDEERGEDADDGNSSLSLTRILGTVWARLDGKRKCYCCLGFVFAAVHATCTPVFSWIFAKLLATFYSPGDRAQKALELSLSLLGVSFIDAISSYMTHYLLESAALFWVDNVRFDVMRRILDQPKAWFESEDARVSGIVEQLNRGAEEMRNLLGRFAGYVFVAVVMMLIGTIWCIVVSWKLTLVGMSTAPVMYAITSAFDMVSTKWAGKSHDATQAASGIVTEVCEKVQAVSALSMEDYFYRKHDAASRRAFKVGVRRAAASSVFFGLSDGSIFFVTALTFWYGSKLVASDLFPVNAVVTVFSILLFVISNVNAIVAFTPQLSSARYTATKLLRLAQLPSLDNCEHLGDTRLESLPGPIWFRRACFRYPSRPAQTALNCLTVEIPREKSTAIVGSSGSGKSTIISLLLRLHSLVGPLTAGSLKVGDIPLSQLDAVSWRALLAYVPQQPKLFPSTLGENIAYGLPKNSPYRQQHIITNAAVHSGVHDFISSLPDGYETVVGEGGVGLSGGQVQKVAIARALIRRPKLLILDEPTSALDAASAMEIRHLLTGLVEVDRMTVLVVTHSAEMMRTMDKVVVLDRGRVVEQGVFDTLMARQGYLKRLLGDLSAQRT